MTSKLTFSQPLDKMDSRFRGNDIKIHELFRQNMLKFLIKNNALLIIISLFGLWLLSGCNDKPTELGFTFVKDTVAMGTVTSYDAQLITGTENRKRRLTLFQTGGLFIGNFGDWKAITLIRLANLPDTLNYLTQSNIISAEIKLYPSLYILGDSNNGRLSFKLHKAIKLWSGFTNWDSVFTSGEQYYDYNPVGSVDTLYKPADTITPISIPFDPSVVEYWSRLLNDSISKRSNWGLVLIPENNSNAIYRFFGQALGLSNPAPYCFIRFINKNTNAIDSVYLSSGYEISLVNSPPPEKNSIIVQGAVSYVTRISFDVSMLPDLSGVHVAEFYLTYNPEKSIYGNLGPDSTLRLELFPDTSDLVAPIRTYYAEKISDENKYKVSSIASAIEYWNRNKIKNCFLLIKADGTKNEYRQIDRMEFYNIDAIDASLRPELRLIYSKRPEFQK